MTLIYFILSIFAFFVLLRLFLYFSMLLSQLKNNDVQETTVYENIYYQETPNNSYTKNQRDPDLAQIDEWEAWYENAKVRSYETMKVSEPALHNREAQNLALFRQYAKEHPDIADNNGWGDGS